MNSVVLVGRLVKDPELNHGKDNDKAYTRCTIAVDRKYKNLNGERETDFIPVVFYGRTAEVVCEYLSKGKMVCINGRIRVESYTDKDGIRRNSTNIDVDHFQFVDSSERKEKIV
ncbi:MAG: single-stranded DNA-binding protein [Bacillota bacterium]|nr:single-stranded DNA-binding protein [Bacillota bacterium]